MFMKTFLAATLLQILLVSSSNSRERNRNNSEKEITIPISIYFNNGSSLPVSKRTSVKIIGLCSEEKNKIRLLVNGTDSLSEKPMNVSVFFASENQEILKVELKEKVLGTKYETPYKVSQTFIGNKTRENKASFPIDWLPAYTTRVSAALEFENDTVYCTYGIKNNAISIRDLMVVQQYRKLDCA